MGKSGMNAARFVCRLCGGSSWDQVADLGCHPLPNDLQNDPAAAGKTVSTVFVICRGCGLLQLLENVDRSRLFATYVWTSSSSAAACAYAEEFSARLCQEFPPADYPHAVEIGSNDGLMLHALQGRGYRVLGVEPSNLAVESSNAGLPTVNAFFDAQTAADIACRAQVDIVVARNVIGHSEDLQGFLVGLKTLIRPGGVAVIESPYAMLLLSELQYDTIFHEHVSYFTITTLQAALREADFIIESLDLVPMNGGSFVCRARRSAGTPGDLGFILELEQRLQLGAIEGWHHFGGAVKEHRRKLRDLLAGLRSEGSSVWVYGAAAKTVVMLNYCGIDRSYVDAIGDNSPRKQGRYAPGVSLPIVAPGQLVAAAPDYVLVGPANMQAEIVEQLRGQGYVGGFIAALPEPEVFAQPLRPRRPDLAV